MKKNARIFTNPVVCCIQSSRSWYFVFPKQMCVARMLVFLKEFLFV